MIGEISAHVVAHEKMLSSRQTETGASGVDEFGAAFTVTLCRSSHLRDALGDGGLGDDELGLPALGLLGLVDGLKNDGEVVTVDSLHIPFKGLEALGGVLALRLVSHRIESDVIRVVDEDEVVEFLVARKGNRLKGDAFLHATVARKRDNVAVENNVLGGVEARSGHLAGNGETNGVGDTLAKRAGGGLDAGRLVELGVSGSLAMKNAEIFHLFERQVVTAQV